MDKGNSYPNVMLAEDYRDKAEADNTKLAHESDLALFRAWGGSIPCSAEQVAAYITEKASTHKAATLARWLASISVAHGKLGLESPTRSLEVKKTQAGIRAIHGAKQRRVSPLCTEDIMAIVDVLTESIQDIRNKALLLVAFSGAMRGSEAVGLTVDRIEFERHGMKIDLGRTKTDAGGADSVVTIPHAKEQKYCPVAALKKWMEQAVVNEGPIFRQVTRHGRIGNEPLTIQGLEKIVKKLALRVGLDPSKFSGHSLRSGLVTSAVRAGKPLHKIKMTTRHRSDSSLTRYIRDAHAYEENASDLF